MSLAFEAMNKTKDDYELRIAQLEAKIDELIVRETIKEMATQMDEFGDDQSNNPVWYKSEKAVKKYFGVEE